MHSTGLHIINSESERNRSHSIASLQCASIYTQQPQKIRSFSKNELNTQGDNTTGITLPM